MKKASVRINFSLSLCCLIFIFFIVFLLRKKSLKCYTAFPYLFYFIKQKEDEEENYTFYTHIEKIFNVGTIIISKILFKKLEPLISYRFLIDYNTYCNFWLIWDILIMTMNVVIFAHNAEKIKITNKASLCHLN